MKYVLTPLGQLAISDYKDVCNWHVNNHPGRAVVYYNSCNKIPPVIGDISMGIWENFHGHGDKFPWASK